ncbi:MAG: hypothetical protein KC492_11575 [Myxococcales bacterium]|nr:hypothetical protein [Myxococcales bacterium]
MPHLEPDMEWSKVSAQLVWDGSLRDLYVFETSEADWDAFLRALSSWPYETSFLIDGEPSELPPSAGAAFSIRERAAPILRVNVSGITVCAHFFTPDELELDIDPREVSDHEKLAALSQFISRLGQVLDRPVLLTHENRPEHFIARYLPRTGEFAYPSPGANSGAA